MKKHFLAAALIALLVSGSLTGTAHAVVVAPNDGSTASNPLLPTINPMGFSFGFGTIPGQRIFIDPPVTIGYDYFVNSGPLFASVDLPSVGDNLFDLSLWDGLNWVFDQQLQAGVPHTFGGAGVDRFRILGIEISANLDPTDPLAFVTGLTFASAGVVNMNMNPLSVDIAAVPEPATLLLIAIGVAARVAIRRRRVA